MHLPWREQQPGGPGPAISTSLLNEEAEALAVLSEGKNVLEIGTAYGFSTTVMALNASHVTTVDPFVWIPSRGEVTENLEVYGVTDKVTVIQDWSFNVLPGLAQGSFDFAFIDGDHSYGVAKSDIEQTLPLMKPGGIIAVHDYMERCCCPGVMRACDESFPSNSVWKSLSPTARLIGSMAVYQL